VINIYVSRIIKLLYIDKGLLVNKITHRIITTKRLNKYVL